MQKILACLSAGILLSALSLNAQITLDPPSKAASQREIQPIELAHSGNKYLDLSGLTRQEIKILNTDGSLFRLISLPTDPEHTLSKQINAISETLFDQDASTIEFIITYKRRYISEDGSETLTHDYYIMNEDGEVLFFEAGVAFIPSGPKGSYIWSSEEGNKIGVMNISPTSADYQAVYFYSLPGTLSQIATTKEAKTAKLSIDWSHLREAPQSVAEIRLFMLDGRLAHVIQVGPAELNLKNHRSQYPKGSYFYQLLSREGKVLQPKRMVKVQ
ncbi:MAG: hypothetical protein AB8H47_12145 [Bacteroidia bacterium]